MAEELEIHVFDDYDTLSQAAAELVASQAHESAVKRGRFNLVLAGGATPKGCYRLLAREPHFSALPWNQMHVFWGDERCVPPDHPDSNYRQAKQFLLKGDAAPDENIHRIRGELGPRRAAADYRAQLATLAEEGKHWPIFDLVILGLGEDGHTASLFPGRPHPEESSQPVIPVHADYEGRPADRVSLTPLIINDSRRVVFLSSGESKAAAVVRALGIPKDRLRAPAQRIDPRQGSVIWYLDSAAASLLGTPGML